MVSNRIIVHALHKSGTMFLFRYFRFISRKMRIRLYSDNGRSLQPVSFLTEKDNEGILVPHRNMEPLFDTEAFHIIHVRNPLDILVSNYYSVAYTHRIDNEKQQKNRERSREMTIDAFCLAKAPGLKARLRPLDLLKDMGEGYLLSSYSDMVLSFEKWNRHQLDMLQVPDRIANKTYKKFHREFNNVPELTLREMKKGVLRHKRKVVPGDYLEKLEDSTIRQLEELFESEIELVEQSKQFS